MNIIRLVVASLLATLVVTVAGTADPASACRPTRTAAGTQACQDLWEQLRSGDSQPPVPEHKKPKRYKAKPNKACPVTKRHISKPRKVVVKWVNCRGKVVRVYVKRYPKNMKESGL